MLASTPKIWYSVATMRFISAALKHGDGEVALVTWDRDLARAAEQVGFGPGWLFGLDQRGGLSRIDIAKALGWLEASQALAQIGEGD